LYQKIIYIELFVRISTGKRQCGTNMFPSLVFNIYLDLNSHETINSLTKHSFRLIPWKKKLKIKALQDFRLQQPTVLAIATEKCRLEETLA